MYLQRTPTMSTGCGGLVCGGLVCPRCGLANNMRCSGWSSGSLASKSEFHGLPLPMEAPKGSVLCCQARPQGAAEPVRDLGELGQASGHLWAMRPHKAENMHPHDHSIPQVLEGPLPHLPRCVTSGSALPSLCPVLGAVMSSLG